DDFYSDINEIVKQYIGQNNPISSDYYIGDFNAALNYENKNLKMQYLRPYDSNKIYPAYKTASGYETDNFQEAKKSFLDSARTEIWYTDFNGKAYRDKNDAKNAIKNSKVSMPILFYTLPDGTKLNPLNKNDINFLKKSVYEQVYDYLTNGTKMDSDISISLYDYGTYKKENVDNVIISSKYSNAFYNKTSILENLLKDILTTFYKAQRDYIFQNIKFDVELVVHNTFKRKNVWAQKLSDIPGKYNGKYKYGITELRFNENTEKKYLKPISNITERNYNKMKGSGSFGSGGLGITKENLESFNNDPLNYNKCDSSYGKLVRGDSYGIYDIDFSKEDSITFPSVPLNELSDFAPFLSNSSFLSNNKFHVKQKKLSNGGPFDMSYAYEVSDFRGCTFIVPFFFHDSDFDWPHGNANDVDFDLFKFGTHSTKETWDLAGTFDVVLKKPSDINISEEKMFEFIKQKINERYMNPNEGDLSCLLFNKIELLIEKIFKNNSNLLWNEIS
ncbi:MAG: hypothetical protein K2L64_02425, partial [Ureaplasma sp.]|nr:hypothetical protein [Ureaplasma sp.]